MKETKERSKTTKKVPKYNEDMSLIKEEVDIESSE